MITPTTIDAPSAPRRAARWRLVAAGLSNVWRFGDLELPSPSGRLLLRGANGTGKTTALEALFPYLLDLNASRLSAGKARTTSLSSLMREGASGNRRYGYTWLTLAAPDGSLRTFGVRIQYSDGASPPVRVIPFSIPGRPLHDLRLHEAGRAPLTVERFQQAVATQGGETFEHADGYVERIGAAIFGAIDARYVAELCDRLRHVRNPALLADISPQTAADALRDALPSVDDDVIQATADALAESDTTRDAFARDRDAAHALEAFAAVWSAHATEVAATIAAAARDSAARARSLAERVEEHADRVGTAEQHARDTEAAADAIDGELGRCRAERSALEQQEAYRDAGRLADLREALAAEQAAADIASAAMTRVAAATVEQSTAIRDDLASLASDIDEVTAVAVAADPAARPVSALFLRREDPRRPLRVANVVAPVGTVHVIDGDGGRLRAAAEAWRNAAERHAALADAARLALSDRKPVEVIERRAADADAEARRRQSFADEAAVDARRASMTAQAVAREVLDSARHWFSTHTSDLAGHIASSLDVDDIASSPAAEAATILNHLEAWATSVAAQASGAVAELRGTARRLHREAADCRVQRDERGKAASELRSGRLLPFPRPDWAGPCDDDAACFGAALEWAAGATDEPVRDRVEATLAAAGLLGADVGARGAETGRWSVSPWGDPARTNLATLVTVDRDHPLCDIAIAVLERIPLLAIATSTDEPAAALVIGLDGSYRAGVLVGRIVDGTPTQAAPPASHIGSRQRRAAALARADLLDREADELERSALRHEALAEDDEDAALRIEKAAAAFPQRIRLREAEADREAAARAARSASEAASMADEEAKRSARQASEAAVAWSERTAARGLPIHVELLQRLERDGQRVAEALRIAAKPMARLAERLDRLCERCRRVIADDRAINAEAEARATRATADQRRSQVAVLEETAGSAIADILGRHAHTSERITALEKQVGQARHAATEAAKAEATARSELAAARTAADAALPEAQRCASALRSLLELPGMADAVLDGETLAEDKSLLAQVERKLAGRRTLARKTVRERADELRARLAGLWSVDPGDDYGELLTYVLTHRDVAYTPTQAAMHAATLRDRAQTALAVSEEHALRHFIVGRLPNAVATAWTRLQDWVQEVNRKMRAAAASSGVAVQVRAPLREDLPAASRTVYELSCAISDVERSDEQRRMLGDAIHSLIAGSAGETMQQRVSDAIDVRDWIDLHYEVTRPGGKMQRWNARTGLSGGERRLVVLAPMLAAVAAGYDRLGPAVLRIVALDEIPAEVDDRGREALARYIAALDLDLLCTSYLWDGCPGAWDGIDAHDLEAGPDGTVVAFPMLVRGELLLPGDPPDQPNGTP